MALLLTIGSAFACSSAESAPATGSGGTAGSTSAGGGAGASGVGGGNANAGAAGSAGGAAGGDDFFYSTAFSALQVAYVEPAVGAPIAGSLLVSEGFGPFDVAATKIPGCWMAESVVKGVRITEPISRVKISLNGSPPVTVMDVPLQMELAEELPNESSVRVFATEAPTFDAEFKMPQRPKVISVTKLEDRFRLELEADPTSVFYVGGFLPAQSQKPFICRAVGARVDFPLETGKSVGISAKRFTKATLDAKEYSLIANSTIDLVVPK